MSSNMSKLHGVQYDNHHEKWKATLHYRRINYHAGYYGSQLEAAHGVNAQCDRLGIPRKNASLGDPPSNFKFTRCSNATYQGLNKGWCAKVIRDSISYYGGKIENDDGGGRYESEVDAGHAVNLICDRIQIPRVNPHLGDPPDGFKFCMWSKAGCKRKFGLPVEHPSKRRKPNISTPESKPHVSLAKSKPKREIRKPKKYSPPMWMFSKYAKGFDTQYSQWFKFERGCKVLSAQPTSSKQGRRKSKKEKKKKKKKKSKSRVSGDYVTSTKPKKRQWDSLKEFLDEKRDQDNAASGRKKWKRSKYVNVYRCGRKASWLARIVVGGKYKSGRYWEKEVDAARAVNGLCDRWNIPRKNPGVGVIEFPSSGNSNLEKDAMDSGDDGDSGKQSEYVGVSWYKRSQQWRAMVAHKGKSVYCGAFYKEIDAAHATNMKCDELGVPRKNPGIGVNEDEDFVPDFQIDKDIDDKIESSWKNNHMKRDSRRSKRKRKKSRIVQQKNVKRARTRYKKNNAQLINLRKKLDPPNIHVPRKRQGRPRKKMQDSATSESEELEIYYETRKSHYSGVSWSNRLQKWKSQVKFGEKMVYGGVYWDEKDAAYAVNIKCDHLGLPKKNIDIGEPPPGFELTVRHYSRPAVSNPSIAAPSLPPIPRPPPPPPSEHRSSESEGEKTYLQLLEKEIFLWLDENSPRELKAEYIASHFKINRTEAQRIFNNYIGSKKRHKDDKIVLTPRAAPKRPKLMCVGRPYGPNSNSWFARFQHQGQVYYCGGYETERQAGHAVNLMCDRLGIARKNPSIGDPPPGFEVQKIEEEESSASTSECDIDLTCNGEGATGDPVAKLPETGEDLWVVEKIEDHRFAEDGTREFLVRWQGYSEPTWEPELGLVQCKLVLKKYFTSLEKESQKFVVKKEIPLTVDIGIVITNMEKELAYVEQADKEFMWTHFAYGNVPLKHIRKIVKKAKLFAAANPTSLQILQELERMKENVMDLSGQVQIALDRGVKREGLTLAVDESEIAGVEIINQNIFNFLQPFQGYLATQEAVEAMKKHRIRKHRNKKPWKPWHQKASFKTTLSEIFSHINKKERSRVSAIVEAQIKEVAQRVLDAVPSEVKPGVCVKKSTVCDGLGLFAKSDLPIGTVIGLFTGKLMTKKEAEYYYGPGTRNRERAFYICALELPDGKSNLVIDPHEFSSRVNHAGTLGDSTPVEAENLNWLPITFNGFPYIAEVVIRPIQSGEEILVNYGHSYRTNPFLGIQPSNLIQKAKIIQLKARNLI